MSDDQQQDIILPIVPRWRAVNRNQRRKVTFELEKNFFRLFKLEEAFLDDLFNPNFNVPYYDLYTHYLDQWQMEIKFMKLNKMFKFTLPQETYFSALYFPMEEDPLIKPMKEHGKNSN